MVPVPIPAKMTVATPCNLNEVAVASVMDVIAGFQPLFKKVNNVKVGSMNRSMRVLPTDFDIKDTLIKMRSRGIIGATRGKQPVDGSVFTQRKNETPFTRQMCFMAGSAVPVSITEFSKDAPDGVDITPRILGRGDVQIYRETNAKDKIIIGIEKRLMKIDEELMHHVSGASPQFVACPNPERIIHESEGSISQQDIEDLYRNRAYYCHAIGLVQPPNIFHILCSFDIGSEVEPLRRGILDIIIQTQSLYKHYFENPQSNARAIIKIKSAFKTLGITNTANKLIDFLISSIMNSIRSSPGNAVRDYKIVNSGYEQIPSDELLTRISTRAMAMNDRAYVFILGCRCIQTTDPAILSRTISSDTPNPHIEYFGGKRMRRTIKQKFRKTPKRKRLYYRKKNI
jgi:hypothetical protein